jgi:transposase-like protein
VDGRSNRRRFADELKRAIVQETGKPGVSVAEVCRRHGIATSMAFRCAWSSAYRPASRPNWQTVALVGRVENEPAALASCGVWCSRRTA